MSVDCENCPHVKRACRDKITFIGVDKKSGRFGDVTIDECETCGSKWLHYFVEYEAFSRSGRWFMGIVDDETLKSVTPESTPEILSNLELYICGGSYFGGEKRKGSGRLHLNL